VHWWKGHWWKGEGSESSWTSEEEGGMVPSPKTFGGMAGFEGARGGQLKRVSTEIKDFGKENE